MQRKRFELLKQQLRLNCVFACVVLRDAKKEHKQTAIKQVLRAKQVSNANGSTLVFFVTQSFAHPVLYCAVLAQHSTVQGVQRTGVRYALPPEATSLGP